MKKTVTLEAIDPIEIYGVGNKILTEFCSYFPHLKVVARGNELILDGKVEVANLIVYADNGSKTKTSLCALQIQTIAITVQFVKTLQSSLGSSQLGCSLSLHGSQLFGSILT